MSKVLVFGEFSSDNIGDVLLGESQSYVYGKNHINISLSTFGGEAEGSSLKKANLESSAIRLHKKVHRWFYSKYFVYRHALELMIFLLRREKEKSNIRKKLENADVVIIGGGQLFSDNSLRMLLHIYYITKIAVELDLNIKIIGSGVPTPKTCISKVIMRKILSFYNINNIYFRDEKSIKVINKITNLELSEKNVIPDFAITYVAKFNKTLKSGRGEVIGLAPISFDCLPHSQKNKVYNSNTWWISLAKLIEKKGYTPVLFCHGTKVDYQRCLDVQTEAEKRGLLIKVLPRLECVQEYLVMINSFRNVVAQRLHISITAFSLGKSPISLPWDDKVRCFYNEAGLNQNFIELPDNKHEDICNLLLNSTTSQHNLKELIDRTDHIIKQQLSGYSNERI